MGGERRLKSPAKKDSLDVGWDEQKWGQLFSGRCENFSFFLRSLSRSPNFWRDSTFFFVWWVTMRFVLDHPR